MKHENFLYHRVPPNMIGEKLYPLNELKNIYPDIYKKAKEKYVGREFVMEQKVPNLNCLWNDVLHFSSVHPQRISDALKNLGQELKAKRFYKINPEKLSVDNSMVYLYKHKLKKDKMLSENWSEYKIEDLEKYSFLPVETLDYYKEQIDIGERPLLWAWVPHIMYKGSIDISDCEIIEVD